MSDLAKQLACDPDWPAPKRNPVFYSMSQYERIERLSTSNWPDLNWSNEWVAFFEEEDFDRQIAVDARSGKLQKAFGLDEMDSIEEIETKPRAKAYLRSIKDRHQGNEGLQPLP